MRAVTVGLRFYGMDGSGNWSHAQRAYVSVIGFSAGRGTKPFFERGGERSRGEGTTCHLRTTRADHGGHLGGDQCDVQSGRRTYRRASGKPTRSAFSPDRCDWSLRCAHAMRDVLLAIQRADLEFRQGFRAFWNTRDEAMAEQLQWILEREGPRCTIGGRRAQHPPAALSGAGATSHFHGLILHPARRSRERPAHRRRPTRKTIKQDAPRAGQQTRRSTSRSATTAFFLDLRRAPESGPVADWLYTERGRPFEPALPPGLRRGSPGIACSINRPWRSVKSALPASPANGESAPPLTERFDDLIGDYVLDGFLGQPTSLSVRHDGNILLAGRSRRYQW